MTGFDPHEPNMSHLVGCPGCFAGVIRREVAKQLPALLAKQPDGTTKAYTKITCHQCGSPTFATPGGRYSRHYTQGTGQDCPKSNQLIPLKAQPGRTP